MPHTAAGPEQKQTHTRKLLGVGPQLQQEQRKRKLKRDQVECMREFRHRAKWVKFCEEAGISPDVVDTPPAAALVSEPPPLSGGQAEISLTQELEAMLNDPSMEAAPVTPRWLSPIQ